MTKHTREAWKQYSILAQKALELGLLVHWVEEDGSDNIGMAEDLTAAEKQQILEIAVEAGQIVRKTAQMIERGSI